MEILRKIIFWVSNRSWTHDLSVSGWICVSHTRTKPVTRKSLVQLLLGSQKILFLSISTWERFSVIYTLSKSPVHLSSPVVFVSVSVCNCASIMCDNNPTRDYLPSLNLPVPMYTTCYFRGPITIIIQSDCSIAIYKCFSLFMFWVVSDYANPKLKDKQYKKKTSWKSNKTEIKILIYPGLA